MSEVSYASSATITTYNETVAAEDESIAAKDESIAAEVEVKKSGISKGNVHTRAARNTVQLNAAAGTVEGVQAGRYDIGDLVFVKHLGWPWPARIEDPSSVPDIVTRFQYVVFLYGIHERKVVKLKDVFLYDENFERLGCKSCSAILNIALVEIGNNPDVNFERIPPHKEKPIQYLKRSRSHAQVVRYLEDNYLHLVTEKGSDGDVTVISDVSGGGADSQFNSTGLVSCDSTLGYFTILSSLMFMAYMTWWLIVMPFLEPNYQQLIDDYFPAISRSLAYPIAAGTVLVSAIVVYVQTQLDS